MELVQLMTFASVALLLVVSPGPNGVLIAKTVPCSGPRAGFANVAGFLCAFYLHGIVSILGISVVLTRSADVFFVVKMLGALYLFWVGANALLGVFQKLDVAVETSAPVTPAVSMLGAWFEGFLTNALNPKVSMFYLAAFPQFIPVGEYATASALLLVSIHAMINLIWFGAMVALLARLSHAASGATFQRVVKAMTGVVFMVFGAKLLTLKSE